LTPVADNIKFFGEDLLTLFLAGPCVPLKL